MHMITIQKQWAGSLRTQLSMCVNFSMLASLSSNRPLEGQHFRACTAFSASWCLANPVWILNKQYILNCLTCMILALNLLHILLCLLQKNKK